MSPRWYDKRTGDYLALDTGGGALARLWATALANKVDTPYVKATGNSVKIEPAEDAEHARDGPRVEDPAVVQRDRARPRADLLRRLRGGDGVPLPRPGASARSSPGNTKVFEDFDVPDEAIGCGFHEAVRGVLSHHLVIRDGKIANYHPYPPTPWNGSPTDSYGTPGPYEDAVMGQPIFEENGQDDFRGHRHHAGGAQLRPVPAVRRAHVPRQGQDARAGRTRRCSASTRGDGRPADTRTRSSGSRRCSSRSSRSPTRPPARPRPSWCRRCSTSTARGWRGIVGARRPTQPRRSPTTSWSRTCCCCTGSIPVPLEARVRGALDEVRPYLDSHGGERRAGRGRRTGVVRLRMEGSCSGCPSSTMTLKLAIEDAIHKAAPEVERDRGRGRRGAGARGVRRR